MTAEDPPDVIDLAEYASQGKTPPKGKHYRLRLDKQPHVSKVGELTGIQILALGGLDPQQYDLFQAIHGGQRIPVSASELRLTPGCARNATMSSNRLCRNVAAF